MVSSLVAPVFGSFTQSAFAQNVGLVAVTRSRAAIVVSAGGVILVLLGLLPVLGRVVAAVPTRRPGRCRHRTLRHGGRQRHPDPGQGGVPEQHEPDHRGRVHRLRHDPDRRPDVLRQVPGLVRHHLPLRHQLGRGHGHPAEPALQPPQGGQLGEPVGVRGRHRARRPRGGPQVPGRRRPLRGRQADRLRRQGSPGGVRVEHPSTRHRHKRRPAAALRPASRKDKGRRVAVPGTTAATAGWRVSSG